MEFYGLRESVNSWKAIIETEFGIACSEPTDMPDREVDSTSFTVELSKGERDFLQVNYWYEIQDGQTSPWNWRIGFVD